MSAVIIRLGERWHARHMSEAVVSLDLCLRVPNSTMENHLSRFRRTKAPRLLTLLTVRAPLPDLSQDQPAAGRAVSEPPAVSPTARIEETRPRDGRVVATKGGPGGRTKPQGRGAEKLPVANPKDGTALREQSAVQPCGTKRVQMQRVKSGKQEGIRFSRDFDNLD
jgi:hypothetical protein